MREFPLFEEFHTHRRRHRRDMADQTEQTARAVDPVDDDAVVTPIRGIHETPIRRNMYISARAFPLEILRESGHGLQLPETTVHCVIGQGGQAGIEFVDKVSEPAIAPESELARPGAGCGLEPGAFMSFKFAPRRIEDIRGQFVQPEVGNEGEMFAWIENHRMGMRPRWRFGSM